MAVKQNPQLTLPDLPQDLLASPASAQAWWRGVKFALEQVLPQLITNVNELVDGNVRLLQMQKLTAAPTNVKEGWVAWADGTNWNPGSGAGLYEYRGATWNKL